MSSLSQYNESVHDHWLVMVTELSTVPMVIGRGTLDAVMKAKAKNATDFERAFYGIKYMMMVVKGYFDNLQFPCYIADADDASFRYVQGAFAVLEESILVFGEDE